MNADRTLMRKNKLLLYIAGPTGIGKTDLSIIIAQKFNTEIISCDSRQFYKELKIGTSPPSIKQLSTVKHHFIHNMSIHDIYNAGKYEKEGIQIINELFEKLDVLILTGGSGLYADAILYGIDNFPNITDNIRNKITEEYKLSGIEVLRERLKKLDKDYYDEVDLNNSNRIIRALEVIESTGKKFSKFRTNEKKTRNFKTHILKIDSDRELLYSRINKRVDEMIEMGLEEEAYKLKKYKNLSTLNTVGYKEFFNYFEGNMSYLDTVNKIKQNTRNYAKRQITWLRKYKEVTNIVLGEESKSINNKIKDIL